MAHVENVEVIEYIFRGIANSRRRILTCSLDERHRVTPTARASEPVNAVAVVWVTVSARGREKAARAAPPRVRDISHHLVPLVCPPRPGRATVPALSRLGRAPTIRSG